MKYGIYDVAEDRFICDEDGEVVEYDSVVDARNDLYTAGYKEEVIGLFYEVLPILPAAIANPER